MLRLSDELDKRVDVERLGLDLIQLLALLDNVEQARVHHAPGGVGGDEQKELANRQSVVCLDRNVEAAFKCFLERLIGHVCTSLLSFSVFRVRNVWFVLYPVFVKVCIPCLVLRTVGLRHKRLASK